MMEANPCHEAINQAILQCSLSGGGTVVVRVGTFIPDLLL